SASNLAIGGGGTVEAFYLLRRALNCPRPPERVIVSLNAGHFTQWDTLWERSVRFGLLDPEELGEVRRTALALRDSSLDERPADGLPGAGRAWLYAIRFPSLYFGGLLKGGFFLRYWDNRQALADRIEARGHYTFGAAPGSGEVAMEGRMPGFVPAPALDHYFDRLLALA